MSNSMKVQILAGPFLKQTAKTQLCLNAVSKGKDINTAHQPRKGYKVNLKSIIQLWEQIFTSKTDANLSRSEGPSKFTLRLN